MFFGKKKLIGLDIGASSVKLAEVNVSSRQVDLESFSIVPTPHGAVDSGGIIEGSELVGETVRQALAELKTKRRLVASGLWGSSVVVKRISIPRMEDGLIREQIRWEAEQYIPYDIKEVNLDYRVLEHLNNENENMDILLVAAKQDAVFGVAEVAEISGLTCSAIDIEGFALANCFEKVYGENHGELIGLFNIGANITNFVVLQSGDIIFCRDVPVGGATYTLALQSSMNISIEEAEQMKISVSMGGAAPDEALSVIKSIHEIVLEEFKLAVEFFLNTSSEQSFTQNYISGGGSRTLGLEDCMREAYGAMKMDVLSGIKCNKKIPPHVLNDVKDLGAVAIGLGLREPGDS